MKKIFTILGVSAAFFMNAQIVINEVYGGGGNSGATLKNDFRKNHQKISKFNYLLIKYTSPS